MCAVCAGVTIFEMIADAFHKLSNAERIDKSSDKLFVPFAFSVKIECVTTKSEVVFIGCIIAKLPHSASGHLNKNAVALDESALCLRMARARGRPGVQIACAVEMCVRLDVVCSDVLDDVGDGWV